MENLPYQDCCLAFTCYCSLLPAAVFGLPPGLPLLLHHLPSRWEVVFAIYLQGESPHAAPTRLKDKFGESSAAWAEFADSYAADCGRQIKDLHRGRKAAGQRSVRRDKGLGPHSCPDRLRRDAIIKRDLIRISPTICTWNFMALVPSPGGKEATLERSRYFGWPGSGVFDPIIWFGRDGEFLFSQHCQFRLVKLWTRRLFQSFTLKGSYRSQFHKAHKDVLLI